MLSGIWLFLVTEIMFFGGLFAAYAIYRWLYFAAFQGGSHILDIRLGAANTIVLLASSLTMALSVRSAQTGNRRATRHVLDRHDDPGRNLPRRQGRTSTTRNSWSTLFPAWIGRRKDKPWRVSRPAASSMPRFISFSISR